MVGPVTTTFNFTGGWQTFKVPGPVKTIEVEMYGGGSGSSPGGRVKGKLRVDGGDVMYLLVGEHGIMPGAGGGGNRTTGGGGAGGDSGPARQGGSSGGGASEIRLNGTGGTLKAVAGGAGGASGDGGPGGAGGGVVGANGTRAGGGSANVATGGTQSKGGNGGAVGSDASYNGENAVDDVSARGGKGGTGPGPKTFGGGGGGGGYHAGGGGQGGKSTVFDGGGGAGGSNFVDGLRDIELNDRSGTTGHGQIIFRYDPDGDPAPSNPSEISINGVEATDAMPTRALGVTIGAKLSDTTTADANGDLKIYMTLAPNFEPGEPGQIITDIGRIEVTGSPVNDSAFIPPGGSAPVSGYSSVTVNGLQANTYYRGRIYAQDGRGQFSTGYSAISFWTDRPPNAPEQTGPFDETEFDSDDTIVFTWVHSDPDEEPGHPEDQNGAIVGYRMAGTVKDPIPGPWININVAGETESANLAAANLTPGRWYEWGVMTRDPLGLWGPSSGHRSFYINAVALPPTLTEPINGEAIYAAESNVFRWSFNTQIADEVQVTADLRYRAYGAEDWETLNGDLLTPGSGGTWLIPPETFNTDVYYEWQMRVHTSNDSISTWTNSQFFYSLVKPGLVIDPIPIDVTRMQEALGQYDNKVYVYKRGGEILVGEIPRIYDVRWNRKRDDRGACTIHVNEWDDTTREMLRSLKPWAHELVVFRNGIRCWEGPITRISGTRASLEIEAGDVMSYVYRRIMRHGYNDAYQIVAGQQVGLHTVVYRAQRIITNALVYSDPNVLPFLTPMHNPGDAIQSRVRKPFTSTAFDEVDDMAAHAGLDYTVSGRRIILSDTHRAIGRLPELSDGDFSDPPIVTVYGMAFATDFGVTNNNGYYGLASRHDATLDETGWVEQLASEYGESTGAGAGTDSLTPEEISALVTTLSAQAERNIASRYPMPVVVRVPDNSTLDPNINLGINQLVPGVWAPLRATEGLVQASQWQKLDSMEVFQDKDGEKISVVFSPAPNGGQDPDADIEEG